MSNKKSNGQTVTPEEAMRKCFVSMSKNCLEIRPRERLYCIFHGRFFLLVTLLTHVGACYMLYATYINGYDDDLLLITSLMLFLCIISWVFEYTSTSVITKTSNIVFNRKTRECYTYYNNKKYINNVDDVIFSGGASTIISLFRREKNGTILTKNISIDDGYNIKIIMDYINNFIRNGHSELPIPTKLAWTDIGCSNVSISPCKALRHYAPWPFCSKITDPEEKALKIYMWPLYTFIMFPINIFFALLWYLFTKIFNIKPHPVPEEAYEGDDSIRVTPEMAAKGIMP
ncbi:hypothetical protein [Hafnia paralvei]|uniref:hypothetical protein n=1 Tax=Hafnia paralvei TaxID=546367 RepID=UPI00107C3DC7|nr:hypothetical protein [Hafnia paralvei]